MEHYHPAPQCTAVQEWEKVRNSIVDTTTKANIVLNTDFIAHNWTEADGAKADVADIILRIMRAPAKAVIGWKDGVPFIPQDELNDPELHKMRMLMSRCRSKGWVEPLTCEIDDVHTIDEILQEHPLFRENE